MADSLVSEFCVITATTAEVGRRVLDMCGGDVEAAVSLWYTDEDLQRSMTNPSASVPDATSTQPSTRRHGALPTRAAAGATPTDPRRIINLDSDEEDVSMEQEEEPDMMDFDDGDPHGAAQAAEVARAAQEDEDAAMAKRLQDELYAQNPDMAGEGGVRAPLGRTTETLVAPNGHYDDDDDDMNAAVLSQMRRRQQNRGKPAPDFSCLSTRHRADDPWHSPARLNNPFSQSIWDDPQGPPGIPSGVPAVLGVPAIPSAASSRDASQSRRAARLTELFRPPFDLMAHYTWDEAREQGKENKKWIMVNLQDMTDFHCQALNRDIWKDDAVKALVQENFIFLQYNKEDMAAQEYITFYMAGAAHENPENYPHVSIIDPRTGEQVKVWSGRPFPNASEFCTQIVDFLDRYSLAAHRRNPVMTARRPEKALDVDRMTEDEMLEMAIKNSIGASGSSAASPSVHDPDSLTKEKPSDTVNAATIADPAKPTISAPPSSVFSGIASDRPHMEPDNNPATTTRIQFRHPEGRVIRRFNLADPVRYIYEWLKAEPLAGRAGVEFELKVMPEGRDLINELEKSISEAGLKNGTVMIEFLA